MHKSLSCLPRCQTLFLKMSSCLFRLPRSEGAGLKLHARTMMMFGPVREMVPVASLKVAPLPSPWSPSADTSLRPTFHFLSPVIQLDWVACVSGVFVSWHSHSQLLLHLENSYPHGYLMCSVCRCATKISSWAATSRHELCDPMNWSSLGRPWVKDEGWGLDPDAWM